MVEAWSDEATFYRFNEHGEWPHPEKMIQTLKEKGIHTVLWQIPGAEKEWRKESLSGTERRYRVCNKKRSLCEKSGWKSL